MSSALRWRAWKNNAVLESKTGTLFSNCFWL